MSASFLASWAFAADSNAVATEIEPLIVDRAGQRRHHPRVSMTDVETSRCPEAVDVAATVDVVDVHAFATRLHDVDSPGLEGSHFHGIDVIGVCVERSLLFSRHRHSAPAVRTSLPSSIHACGGRRGGLRQSRQPLARRGRECYRQPKPRSDVSH